jgi:hypothetical protein
MPTYTSPFTGTVVEQTDVTYQYITLSASHQLYWPVTTPQGEYALSRIMDVQPTAASLYLILPQANEGATGTDAFIVNRGAFTLTVYGYNQTQSWTIAPGVGRYFYLNNNTTAAGFWQNVTLGAGTSVADAASLAGSNLYVRNALLAVGFSTTEITNPPTVTNSSTGQTYIWTGGNDTIQLPAVATLDIGWFIGFRNNGTGTLSFQAQGSSVINTTNTITTNPGDSGLIFFNSTSGDFYTVGLNAPNVVTFTAATYDVDAVVGNTLDLSSNAPIIQNYVALAGTRTQNLNIDLPPITQIYVFQNNTSQPGYDLVFNVAGSVSTPVTVPNNSVVLVVSDGTTLTALTAAAVTGVFQAANGSAASPSFTFISDPDTGLYRANPNVLGIAANGTQMVTIDNSNPALPISNFTGRLNAGSIQGGTF